LIRLPYSLHGKTGLLVKKLTIDELKNFNPLSDAVVFGNDPVKVQVFHPFSMKMMNEQFTLSEGVCEVPTYLAVFLLARRAAELIE
jgi:DNA primase small subunit